MAGAEPKGVAPSAILTRAAVILWISAASFGAIVRADGPPTGEATRAAGHRTGPVFEVVESTTRAVSLRLETDPAAAFPASALVRVPDTGALTSEIRPAHMRDRVVISEPAIMRDLRVVRVTFTPDANGADSREKPESIRIALGTTAEPGVNEKLRRHDHVSPAFRRLYESTVINYRAEDEIRAEPAAPGSGRDALPFGARYLVIVRSSYEVLMAPLAEWKHRKGMQTKVVRLGDIGSTPDDIRTYIQNAYNTWTIPPEYVLLVGDTESVPVYYGLTHTDNYYAAIDGSDYLADVMVGRITADSPAECGIQIEKILGYERTPLTDDPNWPASATLMIADDFDDGDWIYYMNTWFIHDLMDSADFAPIDTLFRKNPINQADVYASVNAGRGFLNFRGQALFNWNWPFDIDPYSTTNGWRLPVVVSATCGTGVFDVDGYVCEQWVRAGAVGSPTGAVAFFGSNTIIPGSQALALRRGYVDEGFMANAFGPEGLTLGGACLAGKLNMYVLDEDEQEYEAWNLLGDPELNLWTAHPFELSVLHDEATPTGLFDFAVTVLRDGAFVENALVACVKDTEVYSWGYTDELGRASLPISPSSSGTMSVTVTARNAFPYEGSVLVLSSGPFVVHAETAIDDSSGGNGDGLLSPGESAEVSVALSNIGNEEATALTAVFRTSEAHTSIVDSTSFFGDVPPDTTRWAQDPFVISVSPDCPTQSIIPFALSLAYAGTTRIVHPEPIEISGGHLALHSNDVGDGVPGGDGDGVPEAGETVASTVTLVNDGECGLSAVEGTLTSNDQYVAVTSGHAAFGDAAPGETCDNEEFPFILSVSPAAPDGHTASLSLAVSGTGHSYQYSETIGVTVTLFGQSLSGPTGPDGHGYYAYDVEDSAYGPAPVFDWYDIAPPGPGVIIEEITDEDAAVVTVGTFFDFKYYGATYDQVSICSNGFVAVGITDYRFGDNSQIPDAHGPPNMIAPFWDDLDPSAGGDIYKWYDLTNHRWIIQFDGVRHWNSPDTETFQVILLDPAHHATPTGDGMILFQYQEVTDPDECTVGIENLTQTDGIQWLHDGQYGLHAAPVVSGSAILFTTTAPEDPEVVWLAMTDFVLDDSEGGNGDGVAQPGESIDLIVDLGNEGAVDATGVSVVLSSAESAISVSDSTATLPDIPAGSSAQNSGDPLTFAVSQAVTDTVATLWLRITANEGAYEGSGRADIRIDLSATGISNGEMPAVFRFRPACPNPFSSTTTMRLALPAPETVSVRVYSPAGQLVKTLANTRFKAGEHAIPWDGTDGSGNRVASGVYFVRVEAGAERATRKVVLLR